jgi:hypothetical protein
MTWKWLLLVRSGNIYFLPDNFENMQGMVDAERIE